jgi:two-component system, LuxR family, response regulator FixJ
MIFNPVECRQRVETLPPSLKEVLKRLADGQPTKQIAVELGISESTVQVYRERIYSKLQANNLAVVIRIAVSANLV